MLKPKDPRELAIKLLKRSSCKVQVAAVLSDKHGIFAWGVNHMGDGYGCHAEISCLQRANHKRVSGSVMWIAARRAKSKNPVLARPCAACFPIVLQCCYVMFRNKEGNWEEMR